MDIIGFIRNITLEDIIQFCSNNFEIILAINFGIVVSVACAFITISITEVYIKTRLDLTRRVLMFIFIGCELVLASMFIYVVSVNYFVPIQEDYFVKKVREDTRWVKSDIDLYFVQGNVLNAVRLNGKDRKTIFGSDSPIREYDFSPDGKFMLIVTQKGLYLLNRKDNTNILIDSLGLGIGVAPDGSDLKGSIGSISWAPDSLKFAYEVSRWSEISSQDNFYVYNIDKEKKRQIIAPTRKISSVYWDKSSENMFYLKYEARDTEKYPYPFEVKVIKIPYDTLKPEVAAAFPADSNNVPMANLGVRGIDLYLDGDKYAFNRNVKKDYMRSKTGAVLGIDDKDYLYVIQYKWFRKRLFKIERRKPKEKTHRYQYGGGDLVVSQIRWIPGDKYIIMDHKDIGLIVMDPHSGWVGKLTDSHGDMFGWYQK